MFKISTSALIGFALLAIVLPPLLTSVAAALAQAAFHNYRRNYGSKLRFFTCTGGFMDGEAYAQYTMGHMD